MREEEEENKEISSRANEIEIAGETPTVFDPNEDEYWNPPQAPPPDGLECGDRDTSYSIDIHFFSSVNGRRTRLVSRWDNVPKRYEIVSTDAIGSGGYGVVVEAVDTWNNNRPVVIKRPENALRRTLDGKRLYREMYILRRIFHPNIVELIDVCGPQSREHMTDLYLVFNRMDADLGWVLKQGRLTERHAQRFLHQLLFALRFLKKHSIIHRNIIPANLLVNQDCSLRLCDFHLARLIESVDQHGRFSLSHRTKYVVTRWYRPPEVLLGYSEYSFEVDMWSAGCIFAEILLGKPLFPGQSYTDQISRILSVNGTPDMDRMRNLASAEAFSWLLRQPRMQGRNFHELFHEFSPAAIDLLIQMLEFDPAQRISVEDALQHEFFADSDCAFSDADCFVRPMDPNFDLGIETMEQIKDAIWSEVSSIRSGESLNGSDAPLTNMAFDTPGIFAMATGEEDNVFSYAETSSVPMQFDSFGRPLG